MRTSSQFWISPDVSFVELNRVNLEQWYGIFLNLSTRNLTPAVADKPKLREIVDSQSWEVLQNQAEKFPNKVSGLWLDSNLEESHGLAIKTNEKPWPKISYFC